MWLSVPTVHPAPSLGSLSGQCPSHPVWALTPTQGRPPCDHLNTLLTSYMHRNYTPVYNPILLTYYLEFWHPELGRSTMFMLWHPAASCPSFIKPFAPIPVRWPLSSSSSSTPPAIELSYAIALSPLQRCPTQCARSLPHTGWPCWADTLLTSLGFWHHVSCLNGWASHSVQGPSTLLASAGFPLYPDRGHQPCLVTPGSFMSFQEAIRRKKTASFLCFMFV